MTLARFTRDGRHIIYTYPKRVLSQFVFNRLFSGDVIPTDVPKRRDQKIKMNWRNQVKRIPKTDSKNLNIINAGLVPRFIIICLFGALPSVLFSKPILVLSAPDIISNYLHRDGHQGLVDEIVKEALDRIGYDLKVTVFPAERSLIMANLGYVDGELARTLAIEQQYKNLIRIPSVIYHAEFVIFSSENVEPINDWHELSSKSVGLVIGMKMIEQNVPKNASISRVKNGYQLFNMLKAGKIKYAVFVKDMGEYILREKNISGVSSGKSILGSVPSYIYLHKKHMHLSKKLTESLSDMRKTGRVGELTKRHSRIFKRDL
ncbi:MAG: transporter substrate-binding domain-containing protein [Pseudomonadales bacterium]|nr:transporter substrate-binding domain-containing protein [Pseudomonadales bacterium]